jgi:anaerobic selenocysteine-containing dehydrogenase
MFDQFNGEPEKCDFCYSRIASGELPVCVMSCMGKAILFGDVGDEKSDISIALKKSHLKVLKPELGTHPSVFYTFSGDCEGSLLNDYDLTGRPPALKMSATQNQPRSPGGVSTARMVYTSDVMCPSECGMSVLVEDGIAKKIYGNKHSLVNSGAFCAKGASGLQMTYSPHRIKSPLIRDGARGEEKWREASWEEAIDYIAKKLVGIKKKNGPESVFLDLGDVTDREALSRLFHAFGTPNMFNHGSICDPNRKWGPWLMTGDERPLPDLQRPMLIRRKGQNLLNRKHDAKLILNLGANPFVATRFNYMSAGIPAAREENGCTYIVIDPSHTNSAALADMWFPIRPGTDGELLAAILYYILKNDSPDENSRRYIDHDFVEKYTVGWPDFKQAFLDYTKKRDPANNLFYFSLDWAEEKTGIRKADIEKIANLFGITKPAAIEIGMHGTAHHTNGDVASILMSALCLLTGNMDRPGGLVFIDSQKTKKGSASTGRDFLEKTVKRSLEGKEREGPLSALNKDFFGGHPAAFKGVLADIPQKIRDGIELRHGPFAGHRYPLKAYISRAGNPVITAGNSHDWIDALTLRDEDGEYRLELTVFIDTHINVTGKYADVVLPEAGFLERMGLSDVYTISPEAGIRDQVIKPLHDSKTDFEMMIALSDGLIRNGDTDVKAVDFRDRYRDEEAFINEVLSEAPGFYNIGQPLPYPDLPEGCRIVGIPDNPTAILNDKVIREGKPLTVEWLRKNQGIAVWPASYHRYKKADGEPSGIYPRTQSKKFEFVFSRIEEINRRLGTHFPTTFYWSDCKWNPKNPSFQELSKEYPFQLITGRVHHAMTMTSVCPHLGETETECMRPMNESFSYRMPGTGGVPNTFGIPEDRDITFSKGSVSIPVFAVNRTDGETLGIKTGDLVTLQNPLKKSINGKVFLTDEIMPGVIKTAFGPGGQKASGIGFMNKTADYTPNINELHDPDNFNRLTGTPGFGDIMVKVIKDVVRDSDNKGS